MHMLRIARVSLVIAGIILSATLLYAPPHAWLTVSLFFVPAFLWDVDLYRYANILIKKCYSQTETTVNEKCSLSKTRSLKRIPGIKSLLIGVIRVYVS